MEINIPTNVQFTVPSVKVKQWNWSQQEVELTVCFTHAVLQVNKGRKVETELTEDSPDCWICRNAQDV